MLVILRDMRAVLPGNRGAYLSKQGVQAVFQLHGCSLQLLSGLLAAQELKADWLIHAKHAPACQLYHQLACLLAINQILIWSLAWPFVIHAYGSMHIY